MENEADSTPVAAVEDAPATVVATPESSAPMPAAPQAAPVPVAPAAPAFDPRRRIRELLSIPERDRSDEEWDELNELEIQTAPGNRIGNQPFAPYNPRGGGGGGGGGGGMHNKNRNNNKNKGPRKPGGGGKPFQGKPNNKPPRPA